MTEFIPTTEQVKFAYRFIRGNVNDEAEFDCWLAKHDEQTILDAIAYLKTTSAVTLVGKGGAYELLEKWKERKWQ